MSDYHKDIQLPSIHTSEEIDQESWYTQAKMLGMWFFFKEKKKIINQSQTTASVATFHIP